MSKSSPPDPNLRQWPPLTFITLYILMLLVYIPVNIYIPAYFFFGGRRPSQPIEIAISFQSIILFIPMVVPLVTSTVCGYSSNSIQVSNGQEKEEWAVDLESAFKTFAQTARFPFDMKHPERTEELARYAKMDFAQYLTNPYDTDHTDPLCLSFFTRRRHFFTIASSSLLALCIAGIQFREWSKHGGIPIKGGETYVQGFGCFLIAFWCHLHWEPMWKVGWVLKMGGITRHIRRECIKNGSVQGSEENVEKSGISVDLKQRLEWRIQDGRKVCEDEHDVPQSELSQLEENREKVCK
ncbi:hypothetical protein OIDMADRAFT_56890 [Oidiodendron maius Zn]|uniref:Uncharacterized protein n=1 Tax=Oidiodendron maius (strain Zn) TaxID=913774 RepID=A0A0C3GR72_OIDMZ|nr:hypothetical protein OIDMADRAFT_56890 [Oidiodendron maius Zn]